MRNLYIIFPLLIWGCSKTNEKSDRFTPLSSRETGISFENTLKETEEWNVLSYEYFYNGGGVGIADFDKNGFVDIFFSGNMAPNQLYFNYGDWNFEDVTEKTGLVQQKDKWYTGVSVADINGDGWLDLYLSCSGPQERARRKNELYLNNGDGTFTEKAADFRLDIEANTTQTVFFDFDKDGDLDAYLLNHSTEDFQNFDATFVKKMEDPDAGDQLLRNDNGQFVDITREAGIKNNPLGFGLGVAVEDFNNDRWPDLYISNDYIEEDYLYINQQDGTFKETLKENVRHISHFSMGNHAADVNNDGYVDLITLDMLPEDNKRQKLLYGPDSYEKYQSMVNNGFHHQNMRNMLQLNNGDGTFVEIGQAAGVSNTDWSWSPLFSDFDRDGWIDLLVTNGYLRDYTNRDFMNYYADQRMKASQGLASDGLMDIISKMESTLTHNYLFKNINGLSFLDETNNWGLELPMLTNGAAVADFDNDGDEDIVLNNVNAPAGIYRNDLSNDHHFISISLKSPQPIGAKVTVFQQGAIQHQSFYPSRGFQSSMYTPILFGLGNNSLIDYLTVDWPNGKRSIIYQPSSDTKVTIDETSALKSSPNVPVSKSLFREIQNKLNFYHDAEEINDLKRQPLLPFGLSNVGPGVAAADVNGDGRVDLYVGGAKMQAGRLYLQYTDGGFQNQPIDDFKNDIIFQDVAAEFFDADEDGDLDLYVVSGGYNYLPEDFALVDRLYLNDGKGNFTKSKSGLPPMRTSGGAIAIHDIDGDSDLDIFVGGRVIPGQYPLSPRSYILLNDGTGQFSDATEQMAPELSYPGMISDAAWIDMNGDEQKDLIINGLGTSVEVYINKNGQLKKSTETIFDQAPKGWWLSLVIADLNGDGLEDILSGNFGENSQMKPSINQPTITYYADFDNNGTIDPILTYYIGNESYPAYSRDELTGQLVSLKKKLTDYKSYAEKNITEIFDPEELERAEKLIVETQSSYWIENLGNGHWKWNKLPPQAQWAPIYDFTVKDFNGDGNMDFVTGGNCEMTRTSFGHQDANYGQVFLGKGDGTFEFLNVVQSGISISGEVRNIISLNDELIFFRYHDTPVFYQTNQ